MWSVNHWLHSSLIKDWIEQKNSWILFFLWKGLIQTYLYIFVSSFARVDDNVRIEEQINLRHLQQLKVLFQEHQVSETPTESITDWWKGDEHEREAGELTRQEFKDALSQVLGTHAYDHQLDVLFSKVSKKRINNALYTGNPLWCS